MSRKEDSAEYFWLPNLPPRPFRQIPRRFVIVITSAAAGRHQFTDVASFRRALENDESVFRHCNKLFRNFSESVEPAREMNDCYAVVSSDQKSWTFTIPVNKREHHAIGVEITLPELASTQIDIVAIIGFQKTNRILKLIWGAIPQAIPKGQTSQPKDYAALLKARIQQFGEEEQLTTAIYLAIQESLASLLPSELQKEFGSSQVKRKRKRK